MGNDHINFLVLKLKINISIYFCKILFNSFPLPKIHSSKGLYLCELTVKVLNIHSNLTNCFLTTSLLFLQTLYLFVEFIF